MELRIAIVEDQEPEARRLELLLRRAFQGDGPICTRFSSGDDLLARFTTGAYEVVFLDICMAGTNGIETARQLREKDPRILIVFVTSSPEYVWDAFPVHPFDYLLKPYKEEKITFLTAELRRVLCRQEPELDVRIARQTVQIPLSKVHYAASQNHIVRVVTDDGECRAAATFSQVEQELSAHENFLVCNRGGPAEYGQGAAVRRRLFRDAGRCAAAHPPEGQKHPVGTLYTVSVPPYAAGILSSERRQKAVNAAQFGRYFLEFALLYPGAYLCLAPLREHLTAPRRTFGIAAGLVTVICVVCAGVCSVLEVPSNYFLLPILIVAFWLLRWRAAPGVSVTQTAFLFAVAAVMLAVCSLLAAVLNARAETGNHEAVSLASTAVIALALSVVLSTIFTFTAVRWSAWLLGEYHGEAFWQSAWPLPAIYAAFLIFCMPRDSAIILINRIMIIAVLAVSISLLGIFLLLYEMYRVEMEYTRNTRLDRENQLLAVESRRYMELRAYMDQTRSLRHDFRQHLHVISGLTEAGELEELKSYLRQYEDELNDARPTLCANPAVDALAGHYDSDARQKGIPVEWKLELPKRLPLPEADLCTLLGNLLENAVFASQKLPPDERQVRVMARMLSPAMLGIVVENRYDGVLKKQKGVLHSTKHEGQGIGLVSIHTTVQKYHGNLTVETENNVFRANVLLNL